MPTFRFWKPYGVLCQFTDPEGRPALADYVKVPGVYAAGRLDFDSEGLLILTSDGALNARLTSPKFAHEKTYWVQQLISHLGFCVNFVGKGARQVGHVFLPCCPHLLKQPRQKLC